MVEAESLNLKLCIWLQNPGAQWPPSLTETTLQNPQNHVY